MRYAEFLEVNQLTKIDLLAAAKGNLVEDPPEGGLAQLPSPPFLMFDRVTSITRGKTQGKIVAEYDVHPDAWFFQCHFHKDPVQPGCLGVDAIWQLVGFFCSLNGAVGAGRALGAKEIEFMGQIRPFDTKVRYEVEIRRFSILEKSGAAVAIGNGLVYVDDELIYRIEGAKVGVFTGITYSDYPNPHSPHAKGGIMDGR